MTKHFQPESVAFDAAVSLARRSAVAALMEGPLDLMSAEYDMHTERVRRALRQACIQDGRSGPFEPADLDRTVGDLEAEILKVAMSYGDAGYLYGLGLGLALAAAGHGRQGARPCSLARVRSRAELLAEPMREGGAR